MELEPALRNGCRDQKDFQWDKWNFFYIYSDAAVWLSWMSKESTIFLYIITVCDRIENWEIVLNLKSQFIFTFSAWFWRNVRQRSGEYGIRKLIISLLTTWIFSSTIARELWILISGEFVWNINAEKSSLNRKGNVFTNIYIYTMSNKSVRAKRVSKVILYGFFHLPSEIWGANYIVRDLQFLYVSFY